MGRLTRQEACEKWGDPKWKWYAFNRYEQEQNRLKCNIYAVCLALLQAGYNCEPTFDIRIVQPFSDPRLFKKYYTVRIIDKDAKQHLLQFAIDDHPSRVYNNACDLLELCENINGRRLY